MTVRKLKKSWQYDFKLPDRPRERRGGYRTKAEAQAAERAARTAALSGTRQLTLKEAYKHYCAATQLRDRTRDSYARMWKRIEPVLGHRYVEEVSTAVLDTFKAGLPGHLSPKSRNNYMALIKAVLRFAWKRGALDHVPHVPMDKTAKKQPEWYSEAERDALLDGIFRLRPHWYLFFYLTARLGLRVGEIYALSRRNLRDIPPQLVVSQSVQRGTKERPAALGPRKNNEAYVLDLPQDVVEAIRWHIRQGYAGATYLFSKDGKWPTCIDSYKRPLREVQEALGLRQLSHHQIGRHSVASQAVTAGVGIKAVQAQLGHRSEQSTHQYAHLGNGAQLRLVEGLTPSAPPHVNYMSTDKKKGT